MENKFLLPSGPLHMLFLHASFSPFLTHLTGPLLLALWILASMPPPLEALCRSHGGLYWFLCHVFPAGISCEHPRGRSPSCESRCCPSGWGPSFREATFFLLRSPSW